MFELELFKTAEDELAEAYAWYEEQKPGLGKKLYKEVNHYFELIIKNPHLFPVRYKEEIRITALKKFPYLIIYWIDESKQTVFVISVFHTSRNPKH